MKILPTINRTRKKRQYLVTKLGAYVYVGSLDPDEITAIAKTRQWGLVMATNQTQAVSLAKLRFPELQLS
jgi:hypothetical protein